MCSRRTQTVNKVVNSPRRKGRVCAENPRRVSCAIEILSFQNFYRVLKTCSAVRKDFFDTPSLRNSDALMRVAVPRRRGPAGLRNLFRFCRNRDLYIRRSWFSACARHGWYHHPRCALCASEMPDGRLSKGLICRFLRLLSSILCAVPFSANMQISLSAISVANAFPPPTTAGLCASSRIASNRTTTVSLGCMDSSSFGCLIVLDSSSTYTTRS